MPLPAPVLDPPFRITRASHAVLAVRDIVASRRFYTEVCEGRQAVTRHGLARLLSGYGLAA